jgi:hypothetical protein
LKPYLPAHQRFADLTAFQSPPALWCRHIEHRSGTKLLCRKVPNSLAAVESISTLFLVGVAFIRAMLIFSAASACYTERAL